MEAESKALARRAVACAGFRLSAGVLIEDPECWEPGATARVEDITPDGLRVKLSGYASGWWTVRPSMLPVLSDYGTLGCIEHGMLPTAWGDGCYVDRIDDALIVRKRAAKGPPKVMFESQSRTLQERLIAALEAAHSR